MTGNSSFPGSPAGKEKKLQVCSPQQNTLQLLIPNQIVFASTQHIMIYTTNHALTRKEIFLGLFTPTQTQFGTY